MPAAPVGGWSCRRFRARADGIRNWSGPSHTHKLGCCKFQGENPKYQEPPQEATIPAAPTKKKLVRLPKGSARGRTRLKDWWERARGMPGTELDGGGLSLEEQHAEISDADLAAGLRRLHVNLGHATKEEMGRVLRLGHARPRAVDRCSRARSAIGTRHLAFPASPSPAEPAALMRKWPLTYLR